MSDRTERIYETAGRAVYEWVRDVGHTIPDDLRATATGAAIVRVADSARANYYRARELWGAGRKTEAANLLQETATTVERVQQQIDALDDSLSGDLLRRWRAWWDASPIGQARRLFDAYMAGLREILAVAPTTAAAAAGGGMLGLAVVLGALLLFGAKSK